MNAVEIEEAISKLAEAPYDAESFPFDFLQAFGQSDAALRKLKSGDANKSDCGGVLQRARNNIHIKSCAPGEVAAVLAELRASPATAKQKARFILATDGNEVQAEHLTTGDVVACAYRELACDFRFFLPLAGISYSAPLAENKLDVKATTRLNKLYVELLKFNPDWDSEARRKDLNHFFARLIFCFFAEDTVIFDDQLFTRTIGQMTERNGSDVHEVLSEIFRAMNVPTKHNGVEDRRHRDAAQIKLYAKDFPYVNGELFSGSTETPKFNQSARNYLLFVGNLDWKLINPDIFGSMIQAVADDEERGALGMHYTSVPNILKVLNPLFLDDLRAKLEDAGDGKTPGSARKLLNLRNRIARIRIFDPACGSGNFLIITYKEIRFLEIKIIQRIIELSSPQVEIHYTQIQLNQFYGIELDDFAHEMAILSLWLAEHQMNKIFEEQLFDYGRSKPILPLKQAGKIVKGNAARENWKAICPIKKDDEVYIIGNPPYLGYARQDVEQKKDTDITFYGVKDYKKLDYISCWFYIASSYIQNTAAKFAFVATNSITQGEQVALLWPLILRRNQEISFAHQSFKWSNNAKGNAGVSVVIIGIRNIDDSEKFLYNKNIKQSVKNISPYLTNTSNVFILPRNKSLSKFPIMIKGSSPSDDGNLLFEIQEKNSLVTDTPIANKFLKKYIGAKEFMNNTYRYCFHITTEAEYKAASKIKPLKQRFDKVKAFRLKSKKVATKKKASTPYFFDEDKHHNGEFILVPQTGSERREYLPVGYFNSDFVPSNATRVIYNVQPWLFGILSSRMHIVWVKAVAGRLKTDMQYSNTLCYNTFPFPDITLKQKENLNLYVFTILDERAKHVEKTMAQLYDPDKMPKGLKLAHEELDRAIEQCYRLQPFTTDTERLEYLFKKYDEMSKQNTLFAKQKKTRKIKK